MFSRLFSRSARQNVEKVPPALNQTALSARAAAVAREENLKTYRIGGFHPVRLGDTFNDGRYAVVRKLGFGVYSTVWLCTDNHAQQYVALKVLRSDSTSGPLQPDEGEILRTVQQNNPAHPGHEHIVKLIDNFFHAGPNGHHSCLVFEVLGESVLSLQQRSSNGCLPLDKVKTIARHTLLGLDYLHRCCNLIHTDLQTGNLLLEIPDVEKRVKEMEPRVDDSSDGSSYTAVASQPLHFLGNETIRVKITDFGVANWVEKHWLQFVQPHAYRAPEVIIEAPWSTPIDIWSFGCIVYEMYVGKYLFNPSKKTLWSYEDDHLAQMMEFARVSSFPTDLLERGTSSAQYFNHNGTLIRIPHLSPATVEGVIKYMNPQIPEDEVRAFADFIGPIMALDPKRRPTAAELLKHPWLNNATLGAG